MKKRISADTEDLKAKMKEMISKCEEIIEMLDKTKDKIEESKEYFDTPTSSYFRDKATSYIEQQKLVINNELIPSFEVLNVISKTYDDEFNAEKKMLDGNNEGDKNE